MVMMRLSSLSSGRICLVWNGVLLRPLHIHSFYHVHCCFCCGCCLCLQDARRAAPLPGSFPSPLLLSLLPPFSSCPVLAFLDRRAGVMCSRTAFEPRSFRWPSYPLKVTKVRLLTTFPLIFCPRVVGMHRTRNSGKCNHPHAHWEGQDLSCLPCHRSFQEVWNRHESDPVWAEGQAQPP